MHSSKRGGRNAVALTRALAACVLAGWILPPTAAAGEMDLSVRSVHHGATDYGSESPEVSELNDLSDGSTVVVDSLETWYAKFDQSAPLGVLLTAATATVRYRMHPSYTGSFQVLVIDGDGTLKSEYLPVQTVATEQQVDFSTEIAGRADPVASAHSLEVHIVNLDTTSGHTVDWTYARVHLEFSNSPPATSSVTTISPGEVDFTDVGVLPTFTGGPYSDPEAHAHASTDWMVCEDASLLECVARASISSGTLTELYLGDGAVAFEGSLEGARRLHVATDYWVSVRYVDELGAIGAWSPGRAFTTSSEPPDDAWSLFGEGGCVPSRNSAAPGVASAVGALAVSCLAAMRRRMRPDR